ncbi:purple acid phosphatase family protein [Desulfofalx alkaliphila]|uniref:purple acid phosphatase family protein n=1 Tax=Desulfofalx alkaliphila TaxID=105483 RepID=UPI0004E11187|nr:metallophosphoesterase family protein [Desulfofalx alkaliphila]
MWFRTNLNLRKSLVSLAVMVLIIFMVINPVSASEGNGGPNTGLPDHIILSWTEDPQTTQTVTWRTGPDSTQNRVQYLPAAGFSGSFAEASEVTATAANLYHGHYQLEATIRGLAPNTSYIYRVGKEGAWSEPATFTTAVDDDKFSFLYMGDVQDGYHYWGEMIIKALEDNPGLKFGMLGGDLVNEGSSIDEWQCFFAAASPVFSQIPLMPAVGNHCDTELFWKSFALPQNGPDGYNDTFYSFDYGNCHITVLNSNYLGVPGIGGYETITNWLENDLKNCDKQWKLLVFHHPPYPVVHDWRADHLQTNWVPLFEEYGVDLVLVGHQHVYMRTKPLKGGAIQKDGEGIVYIMGNAGTKYYGPGPDHDYIAKQLAFVSNYQVIKIDGNTLSITAKDADGQVIDNYVIAKQQDTDNPAYAINPVVDAAYQIKTTNDGINTMTVNTDHSGMKYFSVQVTPVNTYVMLETVVFTHIRDGVQLGINATKADFDVVNTAQAGFNVQPGDMVKVYVVDELTNALDRNPTIFQ